MSSDRLLTDRTGRVLAVQFNNRLLRDREAWLSKTLALKNVRYLK